MKLVTDFILIVGIVLTVLILILLFKSKKRELHRSVLKIFYFFILLVSLHSYANLHKIHVLYKITFLFDFTIIWLFGPLLFIYIKSLFESTNTLVRSNLIHFIPFLLFTIIVGIPLLVNLVSEENYFEYLDFFERNQSFIVPIRNIYFVLYIFLSLGLFRDYRKAMKSNFSTLSLADFGWVKKLLYGCLVFILVDIISRTGELLWNDSIINFGFFTMYSIVVVVAYLGYYGVNQSKILLPSFLINPGSDLNKKEKTSIGLTVVENKKNHLLRVELESVIEKEELYLDGELTLSKLAKRINTTDKKLSSLLNNSMNTTFYDYVNSYRVRAVKMKLASDDSKQYTLLAIAYDCGFNSKASFNRIFKKETGYSPSEFRKLK